MAPWEPHPHPSNRDANHCCGVPFRTPRGPSGPQAAAPACCSSQERPRGPIRPSPTRHLRPPAARHATPRPGPIQDGGSPRIGTARRRHAGPSRPGDAVDAKPHMRSCLFPNMAPFPGNEQPAPRSLPGREPRPRHRPNRSRAFDAARRARPFGRPGGGSPRGLPHRVSCRLLPANKGAKRQKKMPSAGESMSREHRTAAMPGRPVPAGPATLSRHGFPGGATQTCFNAGKTGPAIDMGCGPLRSRATSGARSRRLNGMDRRRPAWIGGGANRAAGCVDGPATGDRSRERERR